MKRLLIVAALALSSCAPLLGTLQGDDASLTRSSGSVLFDAGTTNAEDVAVYLKGDAITVSGSGAVCSAVSTGIGCTLGTVPAGKKFRLIVAGTLTSGSATFYRPGSTRPILTTLKEN